VLLSNGVPREGPSAGHVTTLSTTKQATKTKPPQQLCVTDGPPNPRFMNYQQPLTKTRLLGYYYLAGGTTNFETALVLQVEGPDCLYPTN
jgi:hypothetical protein